MQFLKTVFWVLLAVLVALFAVRNWGDVTLNLWGYIQAGAATLDFDFTGWGDERYEKAAATFRGPVFARLLEDVGHG